MGALGLRNCSLKISLAEILRLRTSLKIAGAKPVTEFGEAGVKVKSKILI